MSDDPCLFIFNRGWAELGWVVRIEVVVAGRLVQHTYIRRVFVAQSRAELS